MSAPDADKRSTRNYNKRIDHRNLHLHCLLCCDLGSLGLVRVGTAWTPIGVWAAPAHSGYIFDYLRRIPTHQCPLRARDELSRYPSPTLVSPSRRLGRLQAPLSNWSRTVPAGSRPARIAAC